MNKKGLLYTYICTLIFSFLSLILIVGCGGRERSATGDRNIPKGCDGSGCEETEAASYPYVRGWSHELYLSNSQAYRSLLQDYRICDPPGWIQIGFRCKNWDNQGTFILEVAEVSFPTSGAREIRGKVIFNVFHDSLVQNRSISIEGKIRPWNSGQGFAMWSENGALDTNDSHRAGRLKIQVKQGLLDDDQIHVHIYYRNKKLASSWVYLDYDRRDENSTESSE